MHVMQQNGGCYNLDGTWEVRTYENVDVPLYFRVKPAGASLRFETSAQKESVKFASFRPAESSDLYLNAFEVGSQEFLRKILDVKSASERECEFTMVDGSTWKRVPTTKQVHLIYMNHLDVGYNTNHDYPGMNLLIPGYIVNVLNWYFQVYFPRAARLGNELRDIKANETFIYTTHPWLVNLYLDCPKITLSEVKLQVRGFCYIIFFPKFSASPHYTHGHGALVDIFLSNNFYITISLK